VTSSEPLSLSPIYAPNFRTGSNNEYDELEEGIVYYVGTIFGTVAEVRVRIERQGTDDLSDDRLFVEVNGQPPFEFRPINNTSDVPGFRLAGPWVAVNGSEDEVDVAVDQGDLFSRITIRVNVPDVALGPINEGFGGLETQINDLPSSATYAGQFAADTFEVIETSPGEFTVNSVDAVNTSTNNTVVNFANGTITGTHSGISFLGEGGSVSGDVVGLVEGTRVGGVLTVDGAASGFLEFGGLTTGAGGSNIRGGVGGVVDGGNGDETVGGSFALSKQ
ncbi:MAG: hypothetical protein AAGA22_09835, partial [Pseudomonadota bacterium]